MHNKKILIKDIHTLIGEKEMKKCYFCGPRFSIFIDNILFLREIEIESRYHKLFTFVNYAKWSETEIVLYIFCTLKSFKI